DEFGAPGANRGDEITAAAERRHRVFRPGPRYAEHHHGAVAGELLQHAAMAQHGLFDPGVELAQEARRLAGADAGAATGESGDVDEQDRRRLLAPVEDFILP